MSKVEINIQKTESSDLELPVYLLCPNDQLYQVIKQDTLSLNSNYGLINSNGYVQTTSDEENSLSLSQFIQYQKNNYRMRVVDLEINVK